MNRIITILVTIFILLLLYIWISHVWGSDKPRHPRQIVDANETGISDESMADADSTSSGSPYDTMATAPVDADEFATERKVAAETKAGDEPKTEPAKPEPVVEKKAEPKPVESQINATPKKTTTAPPKPATTPAKTETRPAATTSVSSTGGKHLVIAGNFTQRANAEQRVKELKKAGFSGAEVVNFDLSEYHTVCAGRFSDVNEARKLVKKLKDYHKIDAYVRIGS